MKKILVTSDGSENSRDAILEAKKLAKCTGGTVTILTVVKSIVLRPYPTVEYKVMHDDEAPENVGQSVLDSAMELVEDFKDHVSTKLRKGDPAEEIMKEAQEGDYDLIVMGNRGLGTFRRTMIGSVSNKVLNHSGKNVLIVR